jgi:hypothetical protein
MRTLLRFEANIACAALRRIVAHPSRRALWFATGALAAVAVVVDVVTSDVASRDLGSWSPSPLLVAAVAAGILAFAAFIGTRTPLTYGTRAADRIWWHYAGVGTGTGQRATTVILAVRATLILALGAVPIGALLALAAPQRAASIIALAAVVVVLAPATVLVSSAFAPRAPDVAGDIVRNDTGAAVSHDAGAVATARPSRAKIPRGRMAARWLVATRRGETLVPYDRFAFGIVAGLVAPHLAVRAGGDLTALVTVVGGLAVIFDAAVRGTTAPATLRSPWWRAAVGTSGAALAAWAFCDSAGVAAMLIGVAFGVGAALGEPLPAMLAVPMIALVPVALRLVVLAVDTFFPTAADRRGAGGGVRAGVVGELTLDIAFLALYVGGRDGALASIATTTVALAVVVIVAAAVCGARLPAAVG